MEIQAEKLLELFSHEEKMEILVLANAVDICYSIVEPHIDEIEALAGMPVQPMFIAYALEAIMPQIAKQLAETEHEEGLLGGFFESIDMYGEEIH